MDPIITGALQQQQQQIAMQVQASLFQRTQEVQKQIGETLIGLIQGAVEQPPGKAIGSGANFDAYA